LSVFFRTTALRSLAVGASVLGCLPALFNFLSYRAPRAKEKLKSMEQCFREGSENIMFSRDDCPTTVPCSGKARDEKLK
jgi:hypothetical protein